MPLYSPDLLFSILTDARLTQLHGLRCCSSLSKQRGFGRYA